MLKTISFATLVAFTATASFAGTLTAPVVEEPVEAYIPVGGSGIGVPAIIGGVVAAAAVAALIADNNDDDDGAVDGHGSSEED